MYVHQKGRKTHQNTHFETQKLNKIPTRPYTPPIVVAENIAMQLFLIVSPN